MKEENQDNRNPASKTGERGQLYEIDLDEHSREALDDAIRDAVEAVERVDGSAPEGDEETEPADGVELSATEATEKLQAKIDSLQERLLRTLADFDNYRKRTDREKEALRRLGIFEVVKDFLGVIDNLERAVESSGNVEDLKHGLQLILRQQQELLRRHGVERIEAAGQVFDPTLHEAVAREERGGVSEPQVIAELQKGYLLYDRLLRPAMVHVAMPVTAVADEETAEGQHEADAPEEPEEGV